MPDVMDEAIASFDKATESQTDHFQGFAKAQPPKYSKGSSSTPFLPQLDVSTFTGREAALMRERLEKDKEMNIRVSFLQFLKLLKPEAIDFFVCLSVCAESSFSLRVAMAVGNCDEFTAQNYLNYLCSLSLLNYSDVGEHRFVFHPLIRLFAQELALSGSLGEVAVARHAHFLINFVKSSDLGDRSVASIMAEELNDIILATKWLLKQERVDYEFISSLKPFLEQYGYWQQAIDLLLQFQLLAERIADWEAAVKFRIQQAKYLSLQGELSKAENLLNPIPTILCKIEDQPTRQVSKAKWLTMLGSVFRRQGRIKEAINALQRAATIEEHLDNKEGLAMVLNSLGTVLRKIGRLDEAEDALRRSYALHMFFPDNQRGIAISLHSLGRLLHEQGRLDEAADTLWRSHTISQELGDQLSLAMVLSSLGGLLEEQGCVNEAIEAFQQGIAIDKHLGDKKSMATKLNRLGDWLQKQGRLDEAAETFQRSIEIGEASGNTNHLAVSLLELGIVLQEQGRLDESLTTFRRSLEISKALNNKKHKKRLAWGLMCLGRALKEQGQLEDAFDVFQSSQKLWEALGKKRCLAITLTNLGEILQHWERQDEAVVFLQRSAALEEQIDNQKRVVLSKRC